MNKVVFGEEGNGRRAKRLKSTDLKKKNLLPLVFGKSYIYIYKDIYTCISVF